MGLLILMVFVMAIPRILEGFDIAAAVARLLDDDELWWQSLGLFVEHYGDWLQEWEGCRSDPVLERKMVHSLRSAAANVGAVRLAAAAEALEDTLSGRELASPAVIAGLRHALREAYRRSWDVAAAAWQAGSAPVAGD